MMQTNCTLVYVFPDGDNYSYPPSWKSDDYEQRYTSLCAVCDRFLHLHYGEPFASCKCGTQEWYN